MGILCSVYVVFGGDDGEGEGEGVVGDDPGVIVRRVPGTRDDRWVLSDAPTHNADVQSILAFGVVIK